ncbi:MAG: FkbM family methyltransferase [Bacteroidota bacterium]
MLVNFIRRKSGAIFHHAGSFLMRSAQWIIPQAVPANKKALDEWYLKKGDDTLRVEYDLGPDAEVWDVGGYLGDWAVEISARYGCRIRVFEPVKEFVEVLTQRFHKNPQIHILPYGLSAVNKNIEFKVMAESSTIFQQKEASSWHGEKMEVAGLRSFEETVKDFGVDKIDLIKINIEGGEYELLEAIIQANWITKVHNIQVQFHDFVPDAEAKMKALQEKLEFTHELTYQYPFVWENWKLKETY